MGMVNMLFYSLKGALFFNEVQIYAFIFTKKGYCLVFLYEIQKKNIFLQSKTSSSGGIGRRAGFKIQFLRKCGFDSHLEYFLKLKSKQKTCKSSIYRFF